MLSEEEIIRNVKRIIEYKVISNYINNYDSRVIQGLLDLYYKQQKEIEEKNIAINKMSKDISHQLKEIEQLKFNNHMVGKWNEYLDKDCISKDKIREKIKTLEKEIETNSIYEENWNKIDILNELLKEE